MMTTTTTTSTVAAATTPSPSNTFEIDTFYFYTYPILENVLDDDIAISIPIPLVSNKYKSFTQRYSAFDNIRLLWIPIEKDDVIRMSIHIGTTDTRLKLKAIGLGAYERKYCYLHNYDFITIRSRYITIANCSGASEDEKNLSLLRVFGQYCLVSGRNKHRLGDLFLGFSPSGNMILKHCVMNAFIKQSHCCISNMIMSLKKNCILIKKHNNCISNHVPGILIASMAKIFGSTIAE